MFRVFIAVFIVVFQQKDNPRMGENNCKGSNWHRVNLLNYICSSYSSVSEKTNSPNQKKKNGGRRSKQTFIQKDIQVANKQEKKCSMSPLLEKCKSNHNEVSPSCIGQNSHHRKSTNNKCCRRYGKGNPLCIVDRHVNWYSHYDSSFTGQFVNWIVSHQKDIGVLIPSIYECDFFGNKLFVDIIKLQWGRNRLVWALNPMTGALIRGVEM